MEDLIVESIQMMGHNCYYIPRESFDAGDMIFGEYPRSKYEKAYLIEAYIQSVDKFEGQNDFFSKFGLEVRDTNTFVISRRSFLRIVPSSVRTRPQEGDLLYVPVFHRMFEVKFAEEETEMFSLGKTSPFTYGLRCEQFRYTNEPISTGQENVDEVAVDNQYSMRLYLGTGTGDYNIRETVYQGTNVAYATSTAIVKDWDSANSQLLVYNIVGPWTAGMNVVGEITNTKYNLQSVNEKSDVSTYDVFDNQQLYEDGNVFIDLTESNPFGSV
jgi:hypothetical protein